MTDSRTEQRAFLAAINAAPEDDTSRLVYADWLEEHDQPARAEFIRVQCALARLPEADPERPALIVREQLLWREYGANWQLPLAALRVNSIVFTRGFPSSIRISAANLLRNADRIFQAAPITSLNIDRISLTDDEFDRVLAMPHLVHLESLAIHAGLSDSEIFKLVACPHLVHLSSLDLSGNWIGPEGARAIARSRTFCRLHEIRLARNQLTDEAATELANSPDLAELKLLDVSANAITDVGARAIANSTQLTRLRTLDLTGNSVGNEGALAIARSATLGALRHVYLQHNRVGPHALSQVARSCDSRELSRRE
jgi:uncharacterized protein (TIGR02996 family)